MEVNNKSYGTGKTLFRLLQISRSNWGWMALLIVPSIIASVIEVGYMESIRRIVKGATNSNLDLVYGGAILGIGIILFRFINSMITTWLKSTLNNNSVTKLQTSMLAKLVRSRTKETQHYHSGDLTSRVWDSARAAQAGFNDSFISMLRNA
ncbi:ABC transporter ATP-binding protein [Paenibacillus sp. GSMTC-2017]|uniref:ABC transporter ATP-binding protein n=1 Tax=Paenibacillus sp. GSMTC-2017 TaxID=2794350 RepID=UPI0018D9AC00|nr:ABC transporter ATP-binding protein [Paenibacillus sp. GSMTC-2017]MBH5318850.1 ABC transporter ATP-binding protein [Paenibacillus sp. GSMTC-2017]